MLSLEEIFKNCVNLSAIQKRRLTLVLGLSQDNFINNGQALVIWVADLLQVVPISVEQKWLITEEFKNYILTYANNLNLNDTEIPIASLIIADRKYALITGCEKILDLNSGVLLDSVQTAFFETISYNLTLLFNINLNSLNKTGKVHGSSL